MHATIAAGKRLMCRSRKFEVARLINRIIAFGRDTSGATAIEYGLIAGAVFLGIVGPIKVIASKMNITYTNILSYFG
jgi:Flp pilus assembly pilin Flp